MIRFMTLLLASAGAFAICPDYTSPSNPAQFNYPAKKSFKKISNTLLASLYTPYHMVHDQIIQSGNTASLIGKFDYDALLHKDLEGESIHVYYTGTNMSNWSYAGRYTTDSDGKISVNLAGLAIGSYQVRMVVEGDLSLATGYVTVVEPGRKAVLFDLDGTLTTNDFEAYADYAGIKTASAYSHATDMVNTYKAKGYQIVYLSARPYWVAKETRSWFAALGIPAWHYHGTAKTAETDVASYKTQYISYLKNTVGLDIIRAYGNAATDITAYANAGIPKSETWIIGDLAGTSGTQAVGSDYTQHLVNVVANTAQSASCS